MKRLVLNTLIAGLTALLITTAGAEQPAVDQSAAVADDGTRSPGDITTEERLGMMKAASGYDNCVYSQAMTNIGEYEDIRHVADFALGECQNKLDELHAVITGFGLPKGYASNFTNRIRSRATRKLLPELAIRKAGG